MDYLKIVSTDDSVKRLDGLWTYVWYIQIGIQTSSLKEKLFSYEYERYGTFKVLQTITVKRNRCCNIVGKKYHNHVYKIIVIFLSKIKKT